MRLPKINLPKISIVARVFLIFALLAPTTFTYAQASPEYTQTINTAGSVQGAQTASSSTTPSDEKGQVKGWFIPIVLGGLLLQALGVDVIGTVGQGIDCVASFHSCVEGAGLIVQNLPYKQATGCNFEVPDNGRYPEGSCSDKKLAAYERGAQLGEIPNAGFLDVASAITNSAMTLPVPVQGSQYFASINPFKEAVAQDINQDVAGQLAANKILLELWTKIRNFSYALLVAVAVVMGFMIMIRWRLDPRTVVTVQSSLPRLVISFILITFSFAISGFMADIIRVFTTILLKTVGHNPFNMVQMLLGTVASATLVTGSVVFITGHIGAIALLFFALLLLFTVLAVFINLMFKIITRYVIFILLTIFAPLFFLFGALPGAEGVITTWFRRVAAALVAIPATAFILQLSFIIGFGNFKLSGTEELPMPWIVPNPVNSIMHWLLLGPVVGLGLFFFATKVPEIVDEAFGIRPLPRGGIGPGFLFGAVAGAGSAGRSIGGLRTGYRAVRTAAGGLTQIGWEEPTTREEGGQMITQGRPARGAAARVARTLAGTVLRPFIPPEQRRWQARRETPQQHQERLRAEQARVREEAEALRSLPTEGRAPQEEEPPET